MSKRSHTDERNGLKKVKINGAVPNHNLESIFLSTIDRRRLDFDFEKVCSVTLSDVNIYACLNCGKYFQGRGKSSPAFLHSIDEDHHVFMNFETLKTYILPDNILVDSKELDDIKYAVSPPYTEDDIKSLISIECLDLNGNSYKPGYIGLNNIKANDYMNVILQALAHTRIIQEKLLLAQNERENDEVYFKNELNKRFTTFNKKLWSTKLFKNHISPHELVQHIGVISNKQFTLNQKKDPKDFLVWMLNNLHRSLLTDKSKSIVSSSFQGKMKIKSQKLSLEESTTQKAEFKATESVKETISKFWILTFDLPSSSLFNDGNVDKIPQVHISDLLKKYTTDKEHVLPNEIRRYSIEKFPPYLIFHYNRFKDSKLEIDLNNKERNQTIIEFPLEIGFKENTIKYKLVSNIIHQCIQNSTNLKDDYDSEWAIQLRRNDEWYEIQNLEIKTKEKELLFLSESYIQVWERIK